MKKQKKISQQSTLSSMIGKILFCEIKFTSQLIKQDFSERTSWRDTLTGKMTTVSVQCPTCPGMYMVLNTFTTSSKTCKRHKTKYHKPCYTLYWVNFSYFKV